MSLLVVSARMDAARWGGPGIVTVTLTNTGDAPFVVNARLAPGYRDSSSRELFADVYYAGTDEIAAVDALLFDRHPPALDDYRELAPGASVESGFDLLDWYRLPGPGAYEVVVSYQGDEPGYALDVPGLLRGTFASARVPFTVTSAGGTLG